MDEHMIIDLLNESYDSLIESIDNSDFDPLFRIESECDFQDSTEDEGEDKDHSISEHNNVQPLQPTWNTVSDNYQKHFNFIGNSGPLVILDEGSAL